MPINFNVLYMLYTYIEKQKYKKTIFNVLRDNLGFHPSLWNRNRKEQLYESIVQEFLPNGNIPSKREGRDSWDLGSKMWQVSQSLWKRQEF